MASLLSLLRHPVKCPGAAKSWLGYIQVLLRLHCKTWSFVPEGCLVCSQPDSPPISDGTSTRRSRDDH